MGSNGIESCICGYFISVIFWINPFLWITVGIRWRKACVIATQGRLRWRRNVTVWINTCTVHLLLFCTVYQQMHNWLTIYCTLVHVLTPLCHLQGARSQYLLRYMSMWLHSWWYNLKLHIHFLAVEPQCLKSILKLS
jgi:hypothetical protein